jgi:hypothetical protein
VAILDGFSMGSGAGIAVAGMFRVATDKTVSDWCYRLTSEWNVNNFLEFESDNFETVFSIYNIDVVAMVFILHKAHWGNELLTYAYMQVFAHPEAQISFHPDAGASFYLSCLVT